MSNEALAWAWPIEGLPAGEKFTLIALANCHNPAKGGCFPSQKYLVDITGHSPRTVRNHLLALEAAGYIKREKRFRENGSQRSDKYHLPIDEGGRQPLPGGRQILPEGVATSAALETVKETVSSNEHMFSSRFEQFWKAYPKRSPHSNGSKTKAFSTFKTKIKNGARPEEIIAGARAYSRYVAGEDMEPQFICMAQTWLNQERWTDEVGEPEMKRAIPDGGYIDYES